MWRQARKKFSAADCRNRLRPFDISMPAPVVPRSNPWSNAMQYLLMIYSNEADEAKLAPGAEAELMAAYGAYAGAMAQADVMVGGERLHPTSAAASVRVRSGKTEVLNGPYAETHEQLGGYFMIDVPDLEAALHWAARCPTAPYGTIEVRPIWAM
jgi:hypothetical protein